MKMNIYNRINAGLALGVVFVLVFATNRIDKNHFETVQNALSTLHEDRVVAQDYVYKMNNIVHEKQLNLVDSSLVETSKLFNKELETLFDVFSATKLTKNESKKFNSLKESFNTLKVNESKPASINNKQSIMANLKAMKSDLNNLALIQVSESRQITKFAQKSLDNNSLMSKLEIGFLVVIGFLIQFIIFYRVKKSQPK